MPSANRSKSHNKQGDEMDPIPPTSTDSVPSVSDPVDPSTYVADRKPDLAYSEESTENNLQLSTVSSETLRSNGVSGSDNEDEKSFGQLTNSEMVFLRRSIGEVVVSNPRIPHENVSSQSMITPHNSIYSSNTEDTRILGRALSVDADLDMAAAEFDFGSIFPKGKGAVVIAQDRTEKDAQDLLNQILNGQPDPSLQLEDFGLPPPTGVRPKDKTESTGPEEEKDATRHNLAAGDKMIKTNTPRTAVGSQLESFVFGRGFGNEGEKGQLGDEGGKGSSFKIAETSIERGEGRTWLDENHDNRIEDTDVDNVEETDVYSMNLEERRDGATVVDSLIVENGVEAIKSSSRCCLSKTGSCSGDGIAKEEIRELNRNVSDTKEENANLTNVADRGHFSIERIFKDRNIKDVTDAEWKRYEGANVIFQLNKGAEPYRSEPTLKSEKFCVGSMPLISTSGHDMHACTHQVITSAASQNLHDPTGTVCPCNSEIYISNIHQYTDDCAYSIVNQDILDAPKLFFDQKNHTESVETVKALRRLNQEKQTPKKQDRVPNVGLNKVPRGKTTEKISMPSKMIGPFSKATKPLPSIQKNQNIDNATKNSRARKATTNTKSKPITVQDNFKPDDASGQKQQQTLQADKLISRCTLPKASPVRKKTSEIDCPGPVSSPAISSKSQKTKHEKRASKDCYTSSKGGSKNLRSERSARKNVNANKIKYSTLSCPASAKQQSSSVSGSSATSISSYVEERESEASNDVKSKARGNRQDSLKPPSQNEPRGNPQSQRVPNTPDASTSLLGRPKLETTKLYIPKKHLRPGTAPAEEYHKYKMDLRLSESLAKIKRGPATVDCHLDPRLKPRRSSRSSSRGQRGIQRKGSYSIMDGVNFVEFLNRNKNYSKVRGVPVQER